MSGNGGGSGPVKGILKKGKGTKTESIVQEQPPKVADSGIQWDEMNILMTEHPANKDYGHMKIEEPKTPYHEMLPDEEQGASSSTPTDTLFSPETLAQKVQEASAQQAQTDWDRATGGEGYSSDEEEVSEEVKEHKRQFSDWRKKHYNEFHAVKRAKELMAEDEDEELMDLGSMEKQGSSSLDDEASLMDDQST